MNNRQHQQRHHWIHRKNRVSSSIVCTKHNSFSVVNNSVCANQMVDMIFVVDGSGSIGPVDFQHIRQFLSSIVDMLHIEPNRSQVAMIQFSDEAFVEFHLRSYQTNEQVKGNKRGDIEIVEIVLSYAYILLRFQLQSSRHHGEMDVQNSAMHSRMCSQMSSYAMRAIVHMYQMYYWYSPMVCHRTIRVRSRDKCICWYVKNWITHIWWLTFIFWGKYRLRDWYHRCGERWTVSKYCIVNESCL